jgi:uncharacterized membrane protein
VCENKGENKKMDTPEIPQPDKAPAGEAKPQGQSSQNGNGGSAPKQAPPQLDAEKLVKWIEATDKELKMIRIGNLILTGTVLFLLFTAAKPKVVPSA